MEELKPFQAYLADRQAKENELSRMRHLEYESNYYQHKIQKDLKEFVHEGRIRKDCSIRKKYNHLLQKSLQRNYASFANLSQFQKYA